MIEMKQTKNLVNIGSGDIIGNGIAVRFWFYLVILIIPEDYGHLHYFISIVWIVSYLTLIGTQNTITVYLTKNISIHNIFKFISIVDGIIGFIVLFFIFERIDIGFLVLGYIINNLVLGEILGKKEYKLIKILEGKKIVNEMRVIILVAVRGNRLSTLTNDKPKCMVKLFGKSLLERQLELFQRFGITNISIVTGYKRDWFKMIISSFFII